MRGIKFKTPCDNSARVGKSSEQLRKAFKVKVEAILDAVL
jgi:hypothetical protein